MINAFTALAIADPVKARRLLLEEMVATAGVRSRAAANLGVSYRSFCRLVTRLELHPEIQRRWPQAPPAHG